jgi:hypothetical protein
MIKILKAIKYIMTDLGLNYEYLEYDDNSEDRFPYFVGEDQESSEPDENGEREIPFIITGFDRKTKINLLEADEAIKKHLRGGLTVKHSDGSLSVVFYEGGLTVPTEQAGLFRRQITLLIKNWRAY